MAKKTSAAKIGAFVLGGLAIAVGAVLAVGSGGWFGQSVERVVIFDESLQGLQVGAPVTYNGIPVGRVERIAGALDMEDRDIRIAVVLALQADSIIADETDAGIAEIVDQLVDAGLRAQLATQSFVTGSLYVSLTFKPDADVYPAPDFFLGIRTLPAVPSEMARIGRVADSLGERLPDAVDRIGEIADRVAAMLDDTNRENLSSGLAAFARFGDSLATAGPEIEELVKSADEAVRRLGSLAESLDAMTARLDGAIEEETEEINATLESLRAASASFSAAMERIDSVVAATRAPLSEFASEGLPRITALAAEAGAAVRQLDQLLDRLEVEGAGFLLQGAPIPEYQPRSQ